MEMNNVRGLETSKVHQCPIKCHLSWFHLFMFKYLPATSWRHGSWPGAKFPFNFTHLHENAWKHNILPLNQQLAVVSFHHWRVNACSWVNMTRPELLRSCSGHNLFSIFTSYTLIPWIPGDGAPSFIVTVCQDKIRLLGATSFWPVSFINK